MNNISIFTDCQYIKNTRIGDSSHISSIRCTSRHNIIRDMFIITRSQSPPYFVEGGAFRDLGKATRQEREEYES